MHSVNKQKKLLGKCWAKIEAERWIPNPAIEYLKYRADLNFDVDF